MLRVQLWTTGFDSQLAPEKAAKQSAGGARSNPHTCGTPSPFPSQRHKRHKQFWEFFKNECKAPRAPKFCRPMGAMRSSINACQKIVKTKYYPNCLNLRNCLSCLPARASSLSVGKNITNISRFPFFEIPSRPSQFQCHFLGASRRYAVGVNQRVSACDIRNVQHQIHLEGGLRYGRCIMDR